MSGRDRITVLRARIAWDRRELAEASAVLREPIRLLQVGWSAADEARRPPLGITAAGNLLVWLGFAKAARIVRWGWVAIVFGAALSRRPGPSARTPLSPSGPAR